MRELIAKLYTVAGTYSKKVTDMLIFETFKSIFEGGSLGGILLLFIRICENIFEGRVLTMLDVYAVFGIILACLAGKIVFAYLADMNKNIASYSIGAKNRLIIGDRLKKVNMGYFAGKRTGNISGGLSSVVTDLETAGFSIIDLLLVGTVQTVIMALFVFPFDFLTGLIILVTVAIGTLVNNLVQKRLDSFTKLLSGIKLNMNAYVLEYVNGISVLKAFGKNKEVMSELETAISDTRKGFLNVEKVIAPVQFAYVLIFKLGTCVIIGVSLLRFLNGQLEIQKAIVLIISSFIVFNGYEMVGSMQNIKGVAIQNLDTLIKLRDLPVISEGKEKILKNSDININNISFAYDEKELFKDMSLQINEGETTAIVGFSGSGKTSLCNLISRFWDVNKGVIYVGDKDVRDYSYDAFLSNFSFVFQDVYLFDDTIKNNIKFGKPDASDDEVKEVAKLARCHDFISSLKDGYDTVLQEGGSNLSGGERQRISIARAMLKPSKIVILDEATSSVDPENEKQLLIALKNLLKGKTVIVIAHKLNTVKDADKIIVLDNGKVESIGKHEELLKNSPIYKKFIAHRESASAWEAGLNT
jgi:hypothetical protein